MPGTRAVTSRTTVGRNLPPVMGVAEIADYAGVGVPAVSNWRQRHEDFPRPLASLRMGDVFTTADVVAYLLRHGYPRGK